MIYLDHAAATPVSPKVRAAMEPYFSDEFFNPSAPYLPAKRTREAYEAAKAEIAQSIGAKSADLVITAGATESINLAFTVMKSNSSALVLETEHAAVLSTAAQYPHTLIKVDQNGVIDLADFRAKLQPSVSLVSISLANNELGTVQPFSEIAEIIRAERAARLASGNPMPLYLHSDASQALNLLDVNVARLGVDLLTLNAAKIYGPKGIGALYVGRGVRLSPVVYGGGQERGLRSGTENVPATIGFATAICEAKEHLAGNRKKYAELSALLRSELKRGSVEPLFLGSLRHQLANFVPVSYPGLDAERLIYKLEAQGVLVATGAACAASKGQKSHVLSAVGLSDAEIAGSLRLSLGALNTPENIKEAAAAINTAVAEESARIRG